MTSGRYVALKVFLWVAEGVGLIAPDDDDEDESVVDEENGEGVLLSLWLATRRAGWGNVM